MILEKQKEANVLNDGQIQESIGMSLDLDSAQILMQMLSKNLYSDDIGSAIRECASNALDSHRRAGVDTPIIVSLKASTNSNYEFCVEDFGIGLDADDVRNIISKYGKSTKRNSATELGMMGLGFKAPLAYSSSFYFVCRKEGMERKYMMYEGEDTNTIDLLYEKETIEINGVKIIIPVKYTDVWQFKKKIKEQLCYFESVYFDVPEDPSITNDFIISRHEDFQFSEMSTDTNMHICLDNVYYPMDFEKLGLQRFSFPIALRFSLSDGLFPTPNRESLRYTQEAKQIITDKLTKVSDYFITKYNDSIAEDSDLGSMINFLEGSGAYINMGDGYKHDIKPFSKFSAIQLQTPKLKGLKVLNFASLYKNVKSSLLTQAFPSKFALRHKRMQNSDKNYVYGYSLRELFNENTHVYIYKDKVSALTKDYLRATCKESDHNFLVKASEPLKLGTAAKFRSYTYYHLLNLGSVPKSKWRDVIKEFQYVMSLIEEKFIDLDALEVPQEFIDSKKKQKVINATIAGVKRTKLKGEILGKKGVEIYRYNSGKNCKFESQIYKLEDLHKFKGLRVYANHEDSAKLDVLYGMMGKQKMEVVTFSTREMKIVDQLKIHNLIPYEKFMEGKTAPFKRMATSLLIYQLINQYSYVFSKINVVKFVSTDLSDKLETLLNYKKLNFMQSSMDLSNDILAIANEHNLFDPAIYSEYLEMMVILEKLSFLNPLCSRVAYCSPEDPIINVISDLFKYYKHKVDLKHYNIRINDEILTEEVIETLV